MRLHHIDAVAFFCKQNPLYLQKEIFGGQCYGNLRNQY